MATRTITPPKTPSEQTVARLIKAGMTAARKAFDKGPSANAWKDMLIWSLAWQQIDNRRHMEVAVRVLFSGTDEAFWTSTAAFPTAVLKALYPNESIDTLIRS